MKTTKKQEAINQKKHDENLKLAYELKAEASNWVDREFNFIQIQLFEGWCKSEDRYVAEFIRQDELTIEMYADWKGDSVEKIIKEYNIEDLESFDLENLDDYDTFRDEKESSNYPMWNTLFEFASEPSEDTIQAAINAGFGIIESTDYLNTMLFASGCGYSFYGAHWIPMYLALPYNDLVREKYKGVKFEMM